MTPDARNGDNLVLAMPSKGRLMEDALALFSARGLRIERLGDERGYVGRMRGVTGVDVLFLSASEISRHLQTGAVHLGVTGEDLLREQMADADERLFAMTPLGFGHADVVVAAPACWLDVSTMADLEEAGAMFFRAHGRRLKVATKYMNVTRRFFAAKGVSSYRIVESLGATEATPAAGAAEAIVDITSTGATLRANHLKVLDDGVILRSQANLAGTRAARWSKTALAALQTIREALERR
ncbi:MAG: ATP phosphoribosyltransferase [Hyphomicrobiales bacterium]|nr:ATP phosphoribosyltransferase [Hyphomicrobiales bacterium]